MVEEFEALSRACRGDRRGDQDAALATSDHVAHRVLGEVDGRADVEVDDLKLVLERGLRERSATTDSGVEGDGVDGTTGRANPPIELLDAVVGREVDLKWSDGRAETFELAGDGRYIVILGGDDQVEVFSANSLASSSPMPLEAPVTTARGRSDEWSISRCFPDRWPRNPTDRGGSPERSIRVG